MFVVLAAYLGGIPTILSPYILPVVPFVFARSDQRFVRSGLPILLGMAVTFAAVVTLAAIGGGWVVEANYYGRLVAILLVRWFGISLVVPQLSERLARPVVAPGSWLSQTAEGGWKEATFYSSLVLGAATGMLWAPCAGPVLGLLLTGAALKGASLGTSFLAACLCCGHGNLAGYCASDRRAGLHRDEAKVGVGEWIRRGLGVAILTGVVAIASGLDTGLLTRLSLASTNGLEQTLVDQVHAMTAEPPLRIVKQYTPVMKAGQRMMMAAMQPSAPPHPSKASCRLSRAPSTG